MLIPTSMLAMIAAVLLGIDIIEMNGIVSEATQRISSRSMVTSIAGGVCLFFGFVVGANLTPALPTINFKINALEKQTLDFTKIKWISDEFAGKTIAFSGEQTTEVLDVKIAFSSFELPKKTASKIKRRTPLRPARVIVKEKTVSVAAAETIDDVKLDFQFAMAAMRSKFLSSVIELESETNGLVFLEEAELPEPPAISITKVISNVKAPPQKREKTKLYAVAVVPQKVKRKKVVVPVPVRPLPLEMPAEVTSIQYPQRPKQEIPLSTQEELSIQINKSSAETIPETIEPPLEPALPAGSLAEEDKEVLKDALLNEQLKNQTANQNRLKVPEKISTRPPVAQKQSNPGPEIEEEPNLAPEPAFVEKLGQCNILSKHEFIKPGATENSQICPERKSWISKESLGMKDNIGWVRLESENGFPTITRHPAPNGGATILLSPDAVALIAIKAGVRVAKGAGIVVGRLPEGFKVEYLGRGEEAEIFELNRNKYFAFLNAEPGAGVIELVSEKDQNLSSSIFVPVLQDTITFADLAKPELKNIFVQVIKSGKLQDAEIAGLTVSISTHRGIQAITQSQGQAAIKNVNVVPGFPVFIDVASKLGNEQSFTYRYELKYKNQYGVYVVNQVTDKNIYKWIRQVPRGISDQSAMVLGSVNSKILNGFKNYYYPRVSPLSEKFGLDPLNYSILWDGKISAADPLEGDKPRFMSVQVPEGIALVRLINEYNQEIYSNVIPVSPRVINVISE